MPQSLKLWSVDDFHKQRVHFNRTMNCIVKQLYICIHVHQLVIKLIV